MCDDAGTCTLRVHHWDGMVWRPVDQTKRAGFGGRPAVVTYREGTQPQRICAFVKGGGELYVNSLWGRWATSTNPVIPSGAARAWLPTARTAGRSGSTPS